jgi:probable HAF family extracellular repeat protein
MGAPAVASWAGGRLDIFVRGTDHQLWRRSYQGGWSGWQLAVSGPVASGPSAVSGASGRVELFASRADQHLYHAVAKPATDVGTLGGRYSQATAVSGNIIVGNADTAAGQTHAFAYDLGAASPKMIDLGTLPGSGSSSAVAVSANIVVGNTAQTAACGQRGQPGCVLGHAFVYDLAAASPKMRDLGTLGGSYSQATAISGNIIVGASATATGQVHAFVYDLGSVAPKMRDLGTLGSGYSQATAVSGNLIVGNSRPAHDVYYDHAFVYDLGASSPQMRDLGMPAGSVASSAVAVSGNIVAVNTMKLNSPDRAFAYDLAAAPTKMIDLGTLRGPSNGARATAVSGNIVVGNSDARTGSPGSQFHPFAYDLGAATPKMLDLGTLFDGVGPVNPPVAVSGNNVVGDSITATDYVHAFVYDLAAASPKMRDLGDLGGGYSEATAVSGNIAVGSSTTAEQNMHAIAWNLTK